MSRIRRDLMHRRDFLRAAGLAGAGAMGCGLALPRLAAAQGDRDTPPRRVVFILAEHGWVYDNLRMRPLGVPAAFGRAAGLVPDDPQAMTLPDPDGFEIDLTDADVALSDALVPLVAYRDKLTVLDGLGLLSAGDGALGDAHTQGHAHALGGAVMSGRRQSSTRPTLDQRIATELRQQNRRLTDLATIEYSVMPQYADSRFSFSSSYTFRYRDDGYGGAVPVPAETNVMSALGRLSPGSAAGPRLGRLVAIQGEMLDALSFEYDRIAQRVGHDDRVRLALHRDILRDLAVREQALRETACVAPELEPSLGSVPQRYGQDSAGFIDLITMAFACDISRVASLRFVDTPTEMFDAVGDLHGNFAHPSAPDFARGANDAQHRRAVEVMTRHMQWHAEQIALLADRLASVPEGDGTMLDNTVIVWVNELSHGNHALDQWPVVMLGGCGGRLRTGRYIRFPQTTPTVFGGMRQFCGVPHTWLLGSIAQAMDTPMLFGEAGATVTGRVTQGPLAGQQQTVAINGVLQEIMA